MPSHKEVTLKSGKRVLIKLPPMDLDFMEQLQRNVVKKALVNPEVAAILTKDEIQELFLILSEENKQFWFEQAQKILGGANQ